jgi:hypothetical protein
VLSLTQLRPVCDRAAGAVAAAVLREVQTIKTITEVGAAQLELDVQSLRSSMCDLPEQTAARDDAPFHFATASRFNSAQMSAYIKTVAREFAAVETLLQWRCREYGWRREGQWQGFTRVRGVVSLIIEWCCFEFTAG